MKVFTYYWFCIAGTLVFLSCKKPANVVWSPSENAVRTFIFDSSSYWIYQEKNSFSFDSVKCTDFSSRVVDLDGAGGESNINIKKTILFNYYASSLNGTYSNVLDVRKVLSNNIIPPYCLYLHWGSSLSYILGFDIRLGNPNVVTWLQGGGAEETILFDSSVVVETSKRTYVDGRSFLLKYNSPNAKPAAYKTTTWVKDVGLAAYTTWDGEEWKLVRWKVKSKWPLR